MNEINKILLSRQISSPHGRPFPMNDAVNVIMNYQFVSHKKNVFIHFKSVQSPLFTILVLAEYFRKPPASASFRLSNRTRVVDGLVSRTGY